ncbi:MAG: cytochrome c peroxidase [Flammeovirgaceae bacterium]|jgi:cytochrome c peroxidase
MKPNARVMRILFSILSLFILFTLNSCGSDSEPMLNIEFISPESFPEPIYNFSKNKVTTEGFELGKSLFFDSMLSKDNTISCASCHNQGAAFANAGHAVSHGIGDQLGVRNAPALQNLAWQKTFFHDGGVFNLDLLSLVPIKDPVEMGNEPDTVLERLRNSSKYQELFKSAFGEGEITSQKFLKSLSQYMNMLVSANSRYDQYLKGEEEFTDLELKGLNLFEQKCASCHSGAFFTDQSFRNNGLEVFNENDEGRANITLQPTDKFKFKVPSLRNIAVSSPYMHDGRLRNLQEVLEHYNSEVKNTPTLDEKLKTDGKLGIPLSSEEQSEIITFLKTLTDKQFIKNKLFMPDR